MGLGRSGGWVLRARVIGAITTRWGARRPPTRTEVKRGDVIEGLLVSVAPRFRSLRLNGLSPAGDKHPPHFGKGAFDRSEVGTCTTCAPRDQAIKGSKLSSAVTRAASERSYPHSVTIFLQIAYSL